MQRLCLRRRVRHHFFGLRMRSRLQRMRRGRLTAFGMALGRAGVLLARTALTCTCLCLAMDRRGRRVGCLLLLRMYRASREQGQRQNRNSGKGRTGSEQKPHVTTLGCRTVEKRPLCELDEPSEVTTKPQALSAP